MRGGGFTGGADASTGKRLDSHLRGLHSRDDRGRFPTASSIASQECRPSATQPREAGHSLQQVTFQLAKWVGNRVCYRL